MSVSWHLMCNLGCCPRAHQLALARPHAFCKQRFHAVLPSKSASAVIVHLLSASAPTVASHCTSQTSDHGNDGVLDDHALNNKRFRLQLEDLVRSPLASPSSSFPFLSSVRLRGVLLLNLLTFLYGSNIPIVKQAEAVANPSLFLCGRFTLATMVLAPFIVRGVKDSEVRHASLELGLWISMGYWTQSISLLTTDAGRASFISAFTVIVVPLLAGLSGREIPKVTWASAIMAFIGVGLLETSGSPATVGDLWSLLSAVLFGVHMFRTEHYSRAISSRKLLPMLGMQLLVITLSSILWSYLVSSLFKGSILPSLSSLNDVHATCENILKFPWLPVIYTGMVSTAFCLWIELTAMREISATDTAVIYCLEPLWGAAFAWCFLGERWGVKGWFGALLILGASLAVQLSQGSDDEAIDGENSKQA